MATNKITCLDFEESMGAVLGLHFLARCERMADMRSRHSICMHALAFLALFYTAAGDTGWRNHANSEVVQHATAKVAFCNALMAHRVVSSRCAVVHPVIFGTVSCAEAVHAPSGIRSASATVRYSSRPLRLLHCVWRA
jgi:hypothetical protein